jgi:hypothetical protein
MNLLDAHKLALNLMREHGLNDWKFAFDKSLQKEDDFSFAEANA